MPVQEAEPTREPRRRFVELMGGGAAAVALSGLLEACGDQGSDTVQQPTPTTRKRPTAASQTQADGEPKGDLAIAQYALTLEHVESAFYRRVVDDNVFKSGRTAEIFRRIDRNERLHVEALTAAVKRLGGRPAAKPKTTFDKIIEGGPGEVLRFSARLENVGAAAYLGQAARITRPELLSAALSIHTVEARQAATLNELAGTGFKAGSSLRGAIPDGPFAKPISRSEALSHLKVLLA